MLVSQEKYKKTDFYLLLCFAKRKRKRTLRKKTSIILCVCPPELHTITSTIPLQLWCAVHDHSGYWCKDMPSLNRASDNHHGQTLDLCLSYFPWFFCLRPLALVTSLFKKFRYCFQGVPQEDKFSRLWLKNYSQTLKLASKPYLLTLPNVQFQIVCYIVFVYIYWLIKS